MIKYTYTCRVESEKDESHRSSGFCSHSPFSVSESRRFVVFTPNPTYLGRSEDVIQLLCTLKIFIPFPIPEGHLSHVIYAPWFECWIDYKWAGIDCHTARDFFEYRDRIFGIFLSE